MACNPHALIFGSVIAITTLISPSAGFGQNSIQAERKRAEDAEARAQSAEKRAAILEKELRRLRASRTRTKGVPSAQERAADWETSRRLDTIILQQHLRDAGRR